MFNAGDIFRDVSREDYFKLIELAEDGEWEIISSTDLDVVRDYDLGAGETGEWIHPERLSERLSEGEVERVVEQS